MTESGVDDFVPADTGQRPRGGATEPNGPLAYLRYTTTNADHGQGEPRPPFPPRAAATDPGDDRHHDGLETGLLL